MTAAKTNDPLLFGADPEEGLVALDHEESGTQDDAMVLHVRRGNKLTMRREPFVSWIFANAACLERCPVPMQKEALRGQGKLNALARFTRWQHCRKAISWLAETTGRSPSEPGAPFYYASDPTQQFLMATGRTSFKGLVFEDIRRLQVDIECVTSSGYEFCNAEREDDRIVAIGLADSTGWSEVLNGAKMDEKAMLKRLVELVQERDPDFIEGHNIFNFDLPYIATRAERHKVALKLGRDGSTPRRRPSQFSVGERTIAYERFDIDGRHIVDTMFLAHAYDISHRSLSGFGLKEVAVHFGLAAPDRTYVEGGDISDTFRKDPDTIMRYVRDDVAETGGVSALLSRSSFLQAQMVPFSYQNICVRGNGMKIDAMMIREYLRSGTALPMPGMQREYAGGYTDMFVQGVVRNVHHCDVRSLYPSLMLQRKLGPATDEVGVFHALLGNLRTVRLDAKEKAKAATTEPVRLHYDALQATFKVLINSFYGYLGFMQGRFCDFDAAERVTSDGRELLKKMVESIKSAGGQPIEIDTDGIYFVPPSLKAADVAEFRREFTALLPEGIEVEFDGEYVAMFSYKMKNYALLDADGEITVKGAALKSRGLEPFQRQFLEKAVRLKMEGKDEGIGKLKDEYAAAIRDGKWPIAMLAKTERLQDAPATYQAKLAKGKRSRNAVYELVLRSGRDYRAGDQLSYYVTGTKKSVAVHEAAKLVSEWNPAARDENTAYYLDKLDALYEKLTGTGEDESPGDGGRPVRKKKGAAK